jgi:hypothetical protein
MTPRNETYKTFLTLSLSFGVLRALVYEKYDVIKFISQTTDNSSCPLLAKVSVCKSSSHTLRATTLCAKTIVIVKRSSLLRSKKSFMTRDADDRRDGNSRRFTAVRRRHRRHHVDNR